MTEREEITGADPNLHQRLQSKLFEKIDKRRETEQESVDEEEKEKLLELAGKIKKVLSKESKDESLILVLVNEPPVPEGWIDVKKELNDLIKKYNLSKQPKYKDLSDSELEKEILKELLDDVMDWRQW